jgi:alpha-ketoglutarate-dependent taurine dioxygenase
MSIPELDARSLISAKDKAHVRQVHDHLRNHGALKVKLGFLDPDSDYLRQIVLGLHEHHGHGLPSTHSSTRGWFWDVRPQPETIQHRAISETMGDFPWHTDSCYETAPAKFFALHVLQHDRCGGGTLSLLNVERLLRSISPWAKQALSEPEFRIAVPPEFSKGDQRSFIGRLLSTDEQGQHGRLRFRDDLLTPLTPRANAAYCELMHTFTQQKKTQVQNLTSELLPRGSIILMDNGRWLHSRNHVRDAGRHLRRVRWDARPFQKPLSLLAQV